MRLNLKRIYEPVGPNDGVRILIDRLWPRGISKAAAELDLWAKEIAPSTKIRLAFGHRPENFNTFKMAYLKELEHNPAISDFIKIVQSHPIITLLYGAKDPIYNHGVVLKEFISKKTN